jgi:hypothetical protein
MKRFISHASQALIEGALVAALVVGIAAGTTFAGKGGGASTGGGKHGGGGTTSGSISLVMVADSNGNGAANWGDTVTYDVSRVGVQNPFITTKCVQGGTTVMTTYAGFYDGYLWPAAKNVLLYGDAWTSGGATCTASVQNTSIKLVYTVAG